MTSGRLAALAIALWLVTAGVFAWFFVHGSTRPGSDNRTAVVLAPGERDFVLAEMRGLLAGVHGVLDGIDRNDRAQIARAAWAGGMAAAADVNPALMAKLPLAFKQLGVGVHRDMDALAQATDEGKPLPQLQNRLTAVLAKCVACHSAWQLSSR